MPTTSNTLHYEIVYEIPEPRSSYDRLQLLVTELFNRLLAGIDFGQQELARLLRGHARLLLVFGLI